jgi:hypothetical protein
MARRHILPPPQNIECWRRRALLRVVQ